ncbi:acetyl-CoA synthetase-like protein [Hymenopellis radicata]|nr:acetyl-CoA synthetase-like protein [Hymenopellis radicata]
MDYSSTFIRPHINIGYGQDRLYGVESLPELIEFNARHNPNHVFALQTRPGDAPAREITFSELQTAVENACAWLVSSGATVIRTSRETKVPPVAILMGSDVGIFIYMAALNRLGTPVLCLSARLTPVAIAHLITETHPSTYSSALRQPIPPKYEDFRYGDRDSLILHSSGTTGLPKAVWHAHAFILTNGTNHNLPPRPDSYPVNLSTLPLYHSFGLLAPCLSLAIGMPLVLTAATVIPTGRSTLKMIEITNANTMFTVPSILEEMLRLPDGAGVDALKKLQFIAVGGAPIKESVAEELTARGVKLLNHWGCTELGAIATIQPVPAGYDWRYIIPRKDTGLRYEPAGDQTYRLVGRAPGWDEPHVVQDLLVVHPSDASQYRIMGRADELLVLANGEKVRPTGMEDAVKDHPSVKAVLAFGEGRESMGLIVELAGDAHADDTLWEYVEKGNVVTDKHGKVTRDMVIVTSEGVKALIRTDKGSLQRKANLALFEEEINRAYEAAGGDGKSAPFVGDARSLLRELVYDVSGIPEYRDGKADKVDFFEAGMDSLQATRLRKAILNSLRATTSLPIPIQENDVESDFCFQYSTLETLTTAVNKLLAGEVESQQSSEEKRIGILEAMVEKYRAQLVAFSGTARDTRARKKSMGSSARDGKVVLLTGSTGSLGCLLLSRLLADESVEKVICVNRARDDGADPMKRQVGLMHRRGAVVDETALKRVSFMDTDVSSAEWTDPEVDPIMLRVTHIIHNAWPVNFNRHVTSFESHIAGLVNLLKLCILSSQNCLYPTRLIFASSVAVVGRYPVLHPNGPCDVHGKVWLPEGKWVCERLIQIADHLYGMEGLKLIRGSSVRIGQMTGAEGCGAWNESEHFPIIIHTSKMMGSLSWMPVNRAGNAIVDLLFSERFRPTYHLENPSRQSWRGVMKDFSSLLNLPLISLDEWLAKVRLLGDGTPAFKIMHFLERDFARMASGEVILGTSEAKEDSKQMVMSTSLDRTHLEEYISYWEKVGY